MNAIAFLIESLLTSFATAFLIEFVRTGYGFTQGDWIWFDSYWSSWAMALGVHALEFYVKALNGSLGEQDERPDPDFFLQECPKTAKHDYGSPLQ